MDSLSIYVSVDNDIRYKYILTKDELIDDHNNLCESEPNSLKITNENGEDLSSKVLCMNTHILLMKPFIEEVKASKCYRNGIFNHLSKTLRQNVKHLGSPPGVIVINVYMIDSYIIDYAWGWRMWRQCHMGLERDCASAWLSTLGGAFSALGDYFSRCAKMALRISVQQIKLSRISGDMDGVARGWLFLALALSQLGYGAASFRLLHMAHESPTYDEKLRSMCLGVQAKLKYDRKVRRLKRSEGTPSHKESLTKLLAEIHL